MINFEKELVYTGAEVRKNKEGKEFVLINVLDNTGKTFGVLFKGNKEVLGSLVPLTKYLFSLSLYIGKNTYLSCLDIA